MPLRVTVSPRTLKAASVEVKLRREKAFELVPVAEAVKKVEALLGAL
jgi:hypothetical protein